MTTGCFLKEATEAREEGIGRKEEKRKRKSKRRKKERKNNIHGYIYT